MPSPASGSAQGLRVNPAGGEQVEKNLRISDYIKNDKLEEDALNHALQAKREEVAHVQVGSR
jgi:hypothetical protein